MYTKKELCFIGAAISLALSLAYRQTPIRASVEKLIKTVADGTHPPPPPQSPIKLEEGEELLSTDGTHPPPPPQAPTSQLEQAPALLADGTHPPPPPWFADVSAIA